MRKVLGAFSAPRSHWVGDGFPVRTIISHATHGKHVSPFMLLDHAGPAEFAPAERSRGVGVHPHRGFETVTIVNDAEIAREAQLVQMARSGGGVMIEAENEARFLVLSGEPIDEPVAMQGPFAMSRPDEIRQAIADVRDGRFGTIPSPQVAE